MSNLTLEKTPFEGVYVIKTSAFNDHRGAFARWFCANEMKDVLEGQTVVNVNFSRTTKKGSVRGMHYQLPPHAETKMVRCIKGKVLDIIVDIRKNSPTFLQHFEIELSEHNMKMIYIPKGFAHGFQSLEDDSEIMYLVTEYYSPDFEAGLNPMDPALHIDWPLPLTDISDKDKNRTPIEPTFSGLLIPH